MSLIVFSCVGKWKKSQGTGVAQLFLQAVDFVQLATYATQEQFVVMIELLIATAQLLRKCSGLNCL